jgi:hypothetical protein
LNPGNYEEQTSNHRIQQIFKRVAIAASVFAVLPRLRCQTRIPHFRAIQTKARFTSRHKIGTESGFLPPRVSLRHRVARMLCTPANETRGPTDGE